MKDTPLTRAIDEVVALKLRATDSVIKELMEQIGDIGNPEKLLKKPYDQWTPLEKQMLSNLYGDELDKFMFNKEYAKLKELEEI